MPSKGEVDVRIGEVIGKVTLSVCDPEVRGQTAGDRAAA